MKTLCHLLAACTALGTAAEASSQVKITTWQVDLRHTGNNASETILTPGNISSPGNFGLLFSQPMDGQTYGQPLLVSGVNVNGTAHNVVYVATQHCSIYAFDADNNTGGNASPLWQVSLLPSGTVPVPQSVVGSGDISVELGITTTPVIDAASSTIYIVSKVRRTSDTTYHQYLYALDLATGATKFGSPVEINPTFPGTSTPDSSGNVIPFNPLREHLRAAMILHDGVIYLTYASHSDTTPYHGEIIGYDATNLQLVKTFITTPNGGNPKGGIWQSGAGPAIDGDGNMYVAVGNGSWDQNNSAYGTNWGESMLKLSTTGPLTVSFANTLNWFTPNNWATLNNGDLDLGSGGLLLLPDQAGPHEHIMVGGGKGAVMYVVDRDNMGGLSTPDNAIQEIPEPNGRWLFVTPAYYNGYIYYSASGGPLQQRAVGYNPVDGTYISSTPITSTDTFNNKGWGCFISSNGTSNGIVWILTGGGIRAYNATNVSGSPIYSANATLPGNIGCQNTKFSLPMVANGKLYYTGYSSGNVGHLLVYGLLPTVAGAPLAPDSLVASPSSSNSITLNWTSNSNNESGFKIKRSTSPNGTFTQVGTAGAGLTSYTDTGLNALTTYYYQVLATNASGDSNATNVASATTFPNYTENGLVSYWSMDETSGSTVGDVTGNAHTGTISGEAELTAGLINYGVNLHGTGQATSRITVANKTDLQFTASQSFSLSAWVFASALRNIEETIIAKSRDSGNYYGIWINAANQWVFRGPGGDVVGPAVTEGAWTHVAVAQDGTANTRTIYINGAASGSGSAQAADGTGALWMGQQNVSGNLESFPGIIDEVRLYSRALAASEITNLMGPPVLEAHSSQIQGSGTFGRTIWPFTAKKIESRKGSASGQYSLVLNFSAPVSGITASLTRQDGNAPVGNVSGVSYDISSRVVTAALTGVGNAQGLYLHLSGITPGNATMDVPFNVLWGDVNSDNVVNSLDLSIAQNSHTTIVNGTSAFFDLNCDGAVNSTDDSLINTVLGTSLGAQLDTNLAIFQPGVASSINGTNTPALAVDTDITTRWESTQGHDPEWIYINLGSICTIHSVVLYWETAGGKDYKIEASNDPNVWASPPLKTVTGNTTVNSYLTYPDLNATGQYLRVYGTVRTGPYGYSLYDLQVIGLSGSGGGNAPTVNSATTANATTGNAFGYQITATNVPTSYDATSLPPGLSVDTGTGLISGTPNQTGTFDSTISATNANGTRSAPLTITVRTPFAGWQNLWFTQAELSDSTVSGAAATPANDGISNLMKYALGLNPKITGVSGLPVGSLSSSGGQKYPSLTYTKAISANDVTYIVEISSDMQTWNSGSSYTAPPIITNNPDGKTQTITVQALTPLNNAPGNRQFMRLKVTP